MNAITLFTDPDAAREQFRENIAASQAVYDASDEPVEWYAVRIPQGTKEGNSTVIFHLVMPDKAVLVVQTTLNLLDGLVSAFRGADARDQERAR